MIDVTCLSNQCSFVDRLFQDFRPRLPWTKPPNSSALGRASLGCVGEVCAKKWVSNAAAAASSLWWLLATFLSSKER